jgi:hypothetical protein
MKLRFLFIAVPAAAVNGVGNVVGGIWGAVTSIF